MTRIITGLFDTPAAAEAVVAHLVQHDGVSRDRINLYSAETSGGETAATTASGTHQDGFWASLKNLFVPDEDRYTYSEGIRRGGVLVSAELEDHQIEHAMTVFEENGAVDLDAREAEWRSSGWQGYDAGAAGTTPAYGAAGAGMVAGAGNDAATGQAATTASTTPAPMTANLAGVDASAHRREEEGVIPVVEEKLRVGKRDTESGRVRVRSYVIETPVSEQVALREENVGIQRRAVDRPLTDADEAFRERTIEAVEHREEAVVSKEARVVEEVVIDKEATERTETIQDTVRRQDVEVEDSRTGTTTPRNPA